MTEDFDHGLRAGFEDADQDRERIKRVKELSRKAPEDLATLIAATIPYTMAYTMEQVREKVAKEWGVDIEDLAGPKSAGLEWRGPIQAISLMNEVNLYIVLREHLQRLSEYAADPSLSREEQVAKVWETVEEVLQALESAKLHGLQVIRADTESSMPEEAAKLAADTEARYLAGHLATRIKMTYERLKTALDEIREHKKLANQERFEVLLRELYVLAPSVWDEHHRTDWQLSDTRNAVVKKIERRLLEREPELPPTEETKLAMFAAREEQRRDILKKGRDAGLPPREYELLKLLAEKPTISSEEAAQRMGITAGTVRVLKSRIKRTLVA